MYFLHMDINVCNYCYNNSIIVRIPYTILMDGKDKFMSLTVAFFL